MQWLLKCTKVSNGISPEIINEVFKVKEETHCHLRHTTQFLVDPIHNVFHDSESASLFGCQNLGTNTY